MSRHSHCFYPRAPHVHLHFPAPTLFAVLTLVELCAAVLLLGIILALLDLQLVKEIHTNIGQAQLLQVVHHLFSDVAGCHWQNLLEQLEGIVIQDFDSVNKGKHFLALQLLVSLRIAVDTVLHVSGIIFFWSDVWGVAGVTTVRKLGLGVENSAIIVANVRS